MNQLRSKTEVLNPACPAEHMTDNDGDDGFINVDLQLQAHSQAILDDHGSLPDIMAEVDDGLQRRYADMAGHDPQRADIAIARKFRAVYRAPVGALVYGGMISVLQSYPADARAEYINTTANFDCDYSTLYYNARYHGQADRWMKAVVSGLLDDAAFPLFDASTASGKIYAALDAYGPVVYGKLADAYEAGGQPDKAGWWRKQNLIKDICNTGLDNITLVMECMIAGQIALARATGSSWKTDELAEMLNRNIPVMARMASVNKSTLANILPTAQGHTPAWDVLRDDGRDLARLENAFTFEGGRLIPKHASIRHRPWRRPGNCSGLYRLRLPDQETTDANGRFFEAAGHPEYGPDGDGAIQAVNSLFGAGIEVGRQTILLPDESPVLKRYVSLQPVH